MPSAQLHADLVVLTGLGLGAEQMAAEAALEAGVQFVAILPYPDPDAVWPAECPGSKFHELLDRAAATIVLQQKPPATKQLAGAALRRRDPFLARHASEAMVVWDGDDASVGRTVRALQEALGDDEVWVIPPAG